MKYWSGCEGRWERDHVDKPQGRGLRWLRETRTARVESWVNGRTGGTLCARQAWSYLSHWRSGPWALPRPSQSAPRPKTMVSALRMASRTPPLRQMGRVTSARTRPPALRVLPTRTNKAVGPAVSCLRTPAPNQAELAWRPGGCRSRHLSLPEFPRGPTPPPPAKR